MSTKKTAPRKPRPVIVNRRGATMWHFNKTFSLDTIFQAVTIIAFVSAPVFYWTRAMEKRIDQLEAKHEGIEKKMADQISDDRDRRTAFMTQFKELNDRMLAIQLDMARIVATGDTNRRARDAR